MRETKRSIVDIVDENLLDLNRSMLKLSNDQIGNLQNQINIEKKNLEILDQNVNGRLDSVNNNLARKLNEIQNVTKILQSLAREQAKENLELKGGSSSQGNVYAMNSSGRKGPVSVGKTKLIELNVNKCRFVITAGMTTTLLLFAGLYIPIISDHFLSSKMLDNWDFIVVQLQVDHGLDMYTLPSQ